MTRILTPGMVPEVTRMILDTTGENLLLLWPDLANNPQRHLLLTAAGTTLDILTQKPAGTQKWQPRLSRADLLAVVETVFAELTANPTWLLEKTGHPNENLRIVLDEALTVVRNHADERMSTATAVDVLRAVVVKAGTRTEFFDKMPGGSPQAGTTLVAAALDVIFSAIFDAHLDPRAAWQMVRSETIVALVDIGLAELAKVPLSPEKVTIFAAFMGKQIDSLTAGEPFMLPTFATDLQKVLATA